MWKLVVVAVEIGEKEKEKEEMGIPKPVSH